MIKESEAQKQRPHELLWMLWFDEKSISNGGVSGNYQVFVDLLCSLKNEVRAK